MHCVKLLGQRLMERDIDRQVMEFRVYVTVLSGDTTPSIHVKTVAG